MSSVRSQLSNDALAAESGSQSPHTVAHICVMPAFTILTRGHIEMRTDDDICKEAVKRKRRGKVCLGCGHLVKHRVVAQSMGRYRLCCMCHAKGGLLYKGDGIYYYMRPSGDIESAAKRIRSIRQLTAPGGQR